MRVLHLCPLWHPISRDSQGGIETFLASLLPALAKIGVESTMIASGDSTADAALIPACEKSLVGEMEKGRAAEYAYYEQEQIALAIRHAADFDLIHSHIGATAYTLSAMFSPARRVLHTVHSLVTGDMQWFVKRNPEIALSTVSELQAGKLRAAGALQCHAIHNGIDTAQFRFSSESGDGLFFIGRMEPVKGPHIAIEVARALGRPLILAGPVVDAAFFERRIAPNLGDGISYVGVVDHQCKNDLFGSAACALLPFRGEEAFGLVAIEAMACGTPVVSLAHGAIPEIVEEGLTGYLGNGDGSDGLADLVQRAARLDRGSIRARVIERFDISAGAVRYAELYEQVAGGVAKT